MKIGIRQLQSTICGGNLNFINLQEMRYLGFIFIAKEEGAHDSSLKLASDIMIPVVLFEDVGLHEIVDFLVIRAKEISPPGINIVLDCPEEPSKKIPRIFLENVSVKTVFSIIEAIFDVSVKYCGEAVVVGGRKK